MALSASALETLLQQAGFRGPNEVTAEAVAMAESSGNPTAYNPSGATGLFQIMPATAVSNGFNPSLLTDPLYNAEAAYKISNKGTNWYPWQAFTNGAYLKYLGDTSQVGQNDSATTPNGSSSASVTSGSSAYQVSDYGGVVLALGKKYLRYAIALGAIFLMARNQYLRPFAWAIIAVAAVTRIGMLGPSAQTVVKNVLGA